MIVSFEHSQLDEIMAENDIPYVILKGVASASYYPNPFLRSMGDVDFLIHEKDRERAGNIYGRGVVHDNHAGKPCLESRWKTHVFLNVSDYPRDKSGYRHNMLCSRANHLR